jgi:hypothetical protein
VRTGAHRPRCLDPRARSAVSSALACDRSRAQWSGRVSRGSDPVGVLPRSLAYLIRFLFLCHREFLAPQGSFPDLVFAASSAAHTDQLVFFLCRFSLGFVVRQSNPATASSFCSPGSVFTGRTSSQEPKPNPFFCCACLACSLRLKNFFCSFSRCRHRPSCPRARACPSASAVFDLAALQFCSYCVLDYCRW